MDETLPPNERPSLPWRPESKTGCGLEIAAVPTWTRDEAVAQARKLGRQRFSLFACMTCTNVFGNSPEWDADPAGCIARIAGRYTPTGFYGAGVSHGEQFA